MTLLEALVVVAVAVLLGTVAFPQMRAARDAAQFRAETAALAADLRAARADAMRRDATVRFAVAADGRGWAWTGAAPRASRARAASDGGRAIAFDGEGGSDGGAVTLRAGARRARVTVDPGTGGVGR